MLEGQDLIDGLVEKVWKCVQTVDYARFGEEEPTEDDVREWATQWVPVNEAKWIQPEDCDQDDFHEWWGH